MNKTPVGPRTTGKGISPGFSIRLLITMCALGVLVWWYGMLSADVEIEAFFGTALFLSPYLIYLLAYKSYRASKAVGLVLLASLIVFFAYLNTSSSSTSGLLGFYYLPANFLVVALGSALDRRYAREENGHDA